MASVLPTDIFCSGGQLSLLVCYKQAAGSIVVMDTVVVSVGGDGAGGLAVVVLVEEKCNFYIVYLINMRDVSNIRAPK